MTTKKIIFGILLGAAAGFVNGFFGGGGGMIIVPLLVFVMRFSVRESHATAIAIILPISIISGVIYALNGYFDLEIGIPTGIGTVVGGLLGAVLLSKLRSGVIVVIFSVVMAVAGIRMLFFA